MQISIVVTMDQVGLLGCARIIIEQMAKVEENERVLILTDYKYAAKELANLMFEDALACGEESVKLLTTPPKETFSSVSRARIQGTLISSEIPEIAKASADAADVIFFCLSSYPPRQVRQNLVEKGKKVILMHLLSDELALKTVPIDLSLLQRRFKKLEEMLPETEQAHLTSLEGTDIKFSLKGCKLTLLYDGICNPGEFDSVPAGVIGALPIPDTANGVLVIDGSLSGYGLVRTPIKMTVEDGRITKIDGGPEATWLDRSMKRAISAGDENADRFAEFDIGLNPAAQVTFYDGKLLEDERNLGGVNIGWGRNVHLGGPFGGQFHGDGIAMDVTMKLDGVTLMKNGVPTEKLS